MMIHGSVAHSLKSGPSRYEECVYSLARTVQEILTMSFFYQRTAAELASGSLLGLAYEQAWYSHLAMFDLLAIDLSRLIESRTDSWNFNQLFKLWRRLVNDASQERAARQALDGLAAQFKWLTEYRKKKVAHRNKDIPSNQLAALPPRINGLNDVTRVMDMFVDGKIPYVLSFHGSINR